MYDLGSLASPTIDIGLTLLFVLLSTISLLLIGGKRDKVMSDLFLDPRILEL